MCAKVSKRDHIVVAGKVPHRLFRVLRFVSEKSQAVCHRDPVRVEQARLSLYFAEKKYRPEVKNLKSLRSTNSEDELRGKDNRCDQCGATCVHYRFPAEGEMQLR